MSGRRTRAARRGELQSQHQVKESLERGGMQVLLETRQISVSWKGPVPPPEVMSQYEDLAPGSAKQMLDMAHAQQQHRMDMEKMVVSGNNRRAERGQVMAFSVVLLAFGFAGWMVFLGQALAGSTALFAAIASLAVVFIRGRSGQEKERAEKREIQKELAKTGRQSTEE